MKNFKKAVEETWSLIAVAKMDEEGWKSYLYNCMNETMVEEAGDEGERGVKEEAGDEREVGKKDVVPEMNFDLWNQSRLRSFKDVPNKMMKVYGQSFESALENVGEKLSKKCTENGSQTTVKQNSIEGANVEEKKEEDLDEEMLAKRNFEVLFEMLAMDKTVD